MRKSEFLDLVAAQAKRSSGLPRVDVDALVPHPYLWVDAQTRKSHAAAAVHAQGGAPGKPHTVVLSCFVPPGGEPQFYIHCGDAFLEGTKDTAAAQVQASTAAPAFTAAATGSLMREHGTMPKSDGCSFWRDWTGEQKLCKHTAHFLNQIRDIDQVLTGLADAAHLFSGQNAAPAPVGVLEELTFRDFAFKEHVLLEGDRGVGKTTEALSYVLDEGCAFFTLQGNAGLEVVDALGMTTFMPGAEKQAVWVDGPLSAAFRSASRGIKTVLVIDEILRIPESQQTVLLGPLAKFRGEYRLNTGRVVDVQDGVGVTEVLTCKREHLWVVATTNVGIEYAVSNMDPALRERFIPLRRTLTAQVLEDHLRASCAKFGPKGPALVRKLVTLFAVLQQCKKDGDLHDEATSRTLCRAVDLVDKPEDVPAALMSQAGLWVGRDPRGNYIPEQLNTVKTAVTKAFR